MPLNPGMGKKILLVDDEKDWLFIPPLVLREAGYEVFTAKDGTEALQVSDSASLDLVILDVNLAGENGVELMKFIRHNHPGVPIILYTGMEHDDQAVRTMLSQGAYRYLRKGSMEELLNVVKSATAGAPDKPA